MKFGHARLVGEACEPRCGMSAGRVGKMRENDGKRGNAAEI